MSGQTTDICCSSVAEAVLAQADITGSRVALVTPFGKHTGHELIAAVTAITARLRERYHGAHSPVIIVMGGDPWTVAALLAANLTDRTAVLLHPASGWPEILAAADTSGARLLLQHAATQLETRAVSAPVETRHGLAWTELERIPPREIEAAAPPGLLCHFTSGTMRSSRLALRSGSAVYAELDTLRRVLDMTEQDVVLCGSAVSHSYGCMGGLLAPLLAGASVRIARTSVEAHAAIREFEPSLIFGLGPMYAQLADGATDLRHALRRVRFAFSAGAPLAAGTFDRVRERLNLPLRQDYGTTETGTISLDLAEIPRPDGVGRPLPSVEIVLRPPEGIPLQAGEEGEVLVRSPFLAAGYLSDSGLVPCADADGWYHTRDAGSRASAELRLHRRLRLLPLVRGERVELDAVESAIAAMPGVLEALVSTADTGNQTVLTALVATRERTLDEVHAWCARELPRNWRPGSIILCERLPRSPAGKILNPAP